MDGHGPEGEKCIVVPGPLRVCPTQPMGIKLRKDDVAVATQSASCPQPNVVLAISSSACASSPGNWCRRMALPMALSREFYAPFVELLPGMVGMEDCESLSTHLGNTKAIAGRHLVRQLLGIQQSPDIIEPDGVCRLPSPENPENGPGKVKGDMVLVFRLLQAGDLYRKWERATHLFVFIVRYCALRLLPWNSLCMLAILFEPTLLWRASRGASYFVEHVLVRDLRPCIMGSASGGTAPKSRPSGNASGGRSGTGT